MIDFNTFVVDYFKDYKETKFHIKLIDELQQFYSAVVSGNNPKLIINVPPRVGKTTFCSVLFPLWLLLNDPTISVSVKSGGTSTSELIKWRITEQGSYIKGMDLITGKYYNKVKQGGLITNTGMNNPVGGNGVNILIIEDPIRSPDDNNKHVSNRYYDYYRNHLLNGLYPTSGVLLVERRRSKGDFTGKILEEEGSLWKHLTFPAIAVEDEVMSFELGRKKGESLIPQREELFKGAKQDLTEDTWESVFQQYATFQQSTTGEVK